MNSDSNEHSAEQICNDFFDACGDQLKANGLNGGYLRTFLEFSFNYEEVEFPKFSKPDVENVLFDVMPRKFSVGPDRAADIIAELSILFEYIKEKYNPERIDSVLSMLQEADIVEELRVALADTSRYGVSKTLVMSAMNLGYDVTDPEDMNDFMALHNEQLMQRLAQKTSLPSNGQIFTRMDAGHESQPSPSKSPVRSPAEQRKFNKERQKALARKKRK